MSAKAGRLGMVSMPHISATSGTNPVPCLLDYMTQKQIAQTLSAQSGGADASDAPVELTLPRDANVFAAKYQLYLPSKEELKAQLEKVEADLASGEWNTEFGR